jgi:hypothetical protein
MEPLRGMKLWHGPTYHPPLKARVALLELNKDSFEAGIGSDQERDITLIKVKGCTVGGLVGGVNSLLLWEALHRLDPKSVSYPEVATLSRNNTSMNCPQ